MFKPKSMRSHIMIKNFGQSVLFCYSRARILVSKQVHIAILFSRIRAQAEKILIVVSRIIASCLLCVLQHTVCIDVIYVADYRSITDIPPCSRPQMLSHNHTTFSYPYYLMIDSEGGIGESCAGEVRDGTTFPNPDRMTDRCHIRIWFSLIFCVLFASEYL